MAKRSKNQAATDKIELARILAAGGAVAGAATGIPIAAPIGMGLGAVTGLIVGDNTTVFPIDMIAIPAYQAYLMQGTPQFTVYIKAGETLVPTGGNVMDMTENMDVGVVSGSEKSKKTRKPSKYNQIYSRQFDDIKKSYMKKDGSWQKNGFKKAVKQAHKLAKLSHARFKGGKK